MNLFTITYDIVTPQSAIDGEVEASGYLFANGEHCNMTDASDAQAADARRDAAMTLRQAIALIGFVSDAGHSLSFYETDGNTDYRTGEHEQRALHLPHNTTASSRARVRRVLSAHRLLY